MRFLFLVAGLLGLAGQLWAHEVRPAVGDLTTDAGRVTLEIELNAEAILAGVDLQGVADTDDTELSGDVDALRALSAADLSARIAAAEADLVEALHVETDGTEIDLFLAEIDVPAPGDLDLPRDTTLRFEGALPDNAGALSVHWPARFGTLILRQQGVQDGYTGYLAGEPSGPIAIEGGGAKGGWATFRDYIPVGFDHILPKGLDHILFVLGLFFLTTRLGPLLWQVSAFTLAHTVTLALGALGWVSVPASIVEPIIAASIVYVAVENILSDRLHRWRPAVIFGFGLLHGLGFASVLGEFGLPEAQFLPALIGFNIGVELGQLAVIAMAFVAVAVLMRTPVVTQDSYRARISVPASLIIALIGGYWAIERVFF